MHKKFETEIQNIGTGVCRGRHAIWVQETRTRFTNALRKIVSDEQIFTHRFYQILGQ